MRSWSLRLGRFFGIDVFVHWTFWILIAWVLLLHFRGSGAAEAAVGVAFVLALFVCVVIHEFGHALTARRFGIVTRDITLYPIGGIASFEGMPERPGQEFLVAIVGPMVNLVIAALLYLLLAAAGRLPSLDALDNADTITQLPFLYSLLLANVMLAVFNLVPAFPMDGGRALRALLSFRMDKVTATRIAAGLGQMLAIIFVFLGFFSNFWLVFIGLFIFIGAGSEVAYARVQSALAGLTVSDAIMHRFTILDPNSTLGEAADALINGQDTAFVIADEERLVGLLTKDEIIRGLAEAGSQGAAAKYAASVVQTVDARTPLTEFFQQSMQAERQVAVVMDAGQPVGLIDKQNVEERLLIQEALRKRSLELGTN